MKFKKDDLKLTFKDIMKDVKVRKGASSGVRVSQAHEDRTKYSKKDRHNSKKSLKNAIHETQILTNVRLSEHQKAVLASIINRDNQNTTVVDVVANVASTNKQNMTSSIQELQKLDMVIVNPDKTLSVSEKGLGVMAENNLLDPATGQLSPEGQEYLHKFVDGDFGKDQGDVDQEMAQTAPIEPPVAEPTFGESFSLLRDLAEQIKLLQFK